MKIGKSRHLKTRDRCPNCDKLLDACTGVLPGKKKREDTAPRPGDFTVCAYCQYLLVFDENVHVRSPTFTELHEIASDPRVLAIKPLLKRIFKP
jgi:hypothetical protein